MKVTPTNGRVWRIAATSRTRKTALLSLMAFARVSSPKVTISAMAKSMAGNTTAVSFAIIAARQAVADAISHPAERRAVESLRICLRDFLCDFLAGAELSAEARSAYPRYRNRVPSTAADISGSGTVTHATDSVW